MVDEPLNKVAVSKNWVIEKTVSAAMKGAPAARLEEKAIRHASARNRLGQSLRWFEHPRGADRENLKRVHDLHDTAQSSAEIEAIRARMKKSSDSTLSRAYLERAVKVASDPDADPRERVHALAIVKTAKAKMQVDPSSLI